MCVFLIRYLCIVISTAQSKRLDNSPQVVTAWVGRHYEYSPAWSASKDTALLMAAWQRAVYRFSKRMQTTWGQKPNTLFDRGCDPTGGGGGEVFASQGRCFLWYQLESAVIGECLVPVEIAYILAVWASHSPCPCATLQGKYIEYLTVIYDHCSVSFCDGQQSMNVVVDVILGV